MERKATREEVYKLNTQSYKELHKLLSKRMGEENPFASYNEGNGGEYIWKDTRCQWFEMTSVSEYEQSIIRETLFQTKQEVARKLNCKKEEVELLFTVPDDSYIYFNNESGKIKILLTAWAFKKPVTIITNQPKVKQEEVVVSVVNDGEKVRNYEFVYIGKIETKRRTDEAGDCNIGDMIVGASFTLKDPKTGKTMAFKVEEGVSHYIFDVTRKSIVLVKAENDSLPMNDEPVHIDYRGITYDLVTNENGFAELELVYHEKELLKVTMRDETKEELIDEKGNEFMFSYKTQTADIIVVVMSDGCRVSGADVNIEYGGMTDFGSTDSNGEFRCNVKWLPDVACCVSVDEYEPQEKTLEDGCENTFVFNREIVKPPMLFSPHIKIEGEKGFIGAKYPITIEYAGARTDYVSDENGIVQLSDMTEGAEMKVIDGLNPDNTCVYELKSDQIEYVFHVPYEPKEDKCDIKVMFRDCKGKPIRCDRVQLKQQELCERLAMLNVDGDIYFSRDTFKIGEPINVNIMGGDKDYGPISFTLVENENEYLLQERETRCSWLRIMQLILTILFLGIVFYISWIVLNATCHELGSVI